MNRTFYYAHVSSYEQNLDRLGYQALKTTMLRPSDTLIVKSFDRLSRNKADIKTELQFFKENSIRLKMIDLPTTMMELPVGRKWVFEMVNNIRLVYTIQLSDSAVRC